MIEVNLYLVPTSDSTVGRLVARSRFDKEAMGVSVMEFVKGFLKEHIDDFQSSLKNANLVNLINEDSTFTVKDFACINYYLKRAGFYIQIQNVTDDEDNAENIPEGRVEWNVIDTNFMQNGYPTTIKIIPEEGNDIVGTLEKVIESSGFFDEGKFSGIKNPFTALLANLKHIKEMTGVVNSGITTKVYAVLDELGVKLFCATSID